MNDHPAKQQRASWQIAVWIVALFVFSLFLYQQAASAKRWISLPAVLLSLGMLCRLTGAHGSAGVLRRTLSIAAWVFFVGFAVASAGLVLTE